VNNTRTCSRSLDISCGTNPNLTNPNYIAQLYLWIIRGLLRGRYTHAKHIYSHARARYFLTRYGRSSFTCATLLPQYLSIAIF